MHVECHSDVWTFTYACRFVETGAFKAFRDNGAMQLPEFGTQVGKLRTLWLTLMGMTGLGQGKLHSSTTGGHGVSAPQQYMHSLIVTPLQRAMSEWPDMKTLRLQHYDPCELKSTVWC